MTGKKKVICIFIDGIGIGKKKKSINPFYKVNSEYLPLYGINKITRIKDGGVIFPVDTTLKVDGLPQSATGQSSIMTGINTAKILKRHLYGFPNKKLRKQIMSNNLLKEVKFRGLKPVFINCYPAHSKYLNEKLVWINPDGSIGTDENINTGFIKKISVTTVCAFSTGQCFFNFEDLLNCRCVYQDMTNSILIEKGFKISEYSPDKCGKIIVRQLEQFDFILYEYFLTDAAGHRRNMDYSVKEINKLEIFIKTIVQSVSLKETAVVIVSDHGNIEDLSTNKHTVNKVPFIVWTEKIDSYKFNVSDITHLFNALLNLCT